MRAGVPGINQRHPCRPPELAAALSYAREGDVLVVARLDRLARSMRQLLTTVEDLEDAGSVYARCTRASILRPPPAG